MKEALKEIFDLAEWGLGILFVVVALTSLVIWVLGQEALKIAIPWLIYTLVIVGCTAAAYWLVTWLIRRFYGTRAVVAERDRDYVLARNEARLSDISIQRSQAALEQEIQAGWLNLRQMAAGTLYTSKLHEATYSSHTKSIATLNDGVPLLGEPVVAQWPQLVRLFDLLPNRHGDANNIILGVNVNEETGKQTVISVPLEDMVHEASGGETGTGKSTLAYAIAYQLITAHQDVSLVLADPAGTTWKTLSQCDRLMYPIISSNGDLLHVFGELLKETERRTNELFAPYPTVEKLSEYNRLVGPGDQLGYIVAMIDEFPDYVENRDIEVLIKRLVRKSRKAGIYIFAMGTSWKATDMDTSIKRQFRTKIHFAASDVQSSQVLLGSRRAAELKEPGRAYARLPFGTSADLVEMQCVYLDKAEAMEFLTPQSIFELPVAAGDGPGLAEKALIDAYQNGESENQCYRIYHQVSTGESWPEGKRLGSQHTKQVKDVLRKYNIPLRD